MPKNDENGILKSLHNVKVRARHGIIRAVEDKIAEYQRRQYDGGDGAHARGKFLFEKHDQPPERAHSHRDENSPQERKFQTDDVQECMVKIFIAPQRHSQPLDKDEADDEFDQCGQESDGDKVQDKHRRRTDKGAQAGRVFPFHLGVKFTHVARKGSAERKPDDERHRAVQVTEREGEHAAVVGFPQDDKTHRLEKPAEQCHCRCQQKIFTYGLKAVSFQQRFFFHA